MLSDTGSLPTALYRAEQVRLLDQRAITEQGIPGYTLMCRAAAAALVALQQHWPQARTLTVIAGAGNNGGDGYVLARLAQAAGLVSQVVYLSDPATLQHDAATAYQDALAAAVPIAPFTQAALTADVLVDALFGTGLARAVTGAYQAAITAINASGRPVLAIDIPSGLQADSGSVLGCAVRAAVTVTFIALKQGLFSGAGPEQCGQIVFADLAVPPVVFAGIEPTCQRYTGDDLLTRLPRRNRTGHKGDYGHVLIIGGDHGMAGAARMSAEAAARCGAGLVSIATRREHAAMQAALRPELMFRGVENAAELKPLLERADVVAIGPGLGTQDWGRALLAAVLATALPLVVDADALNLLAVAPQRRDNWILTPHPGEAARLLGMDTATLQQDRFAAARRLHERYGGVAVLKGAGSLIAAADGSLTVVNTGNPGMASGGMGDLLTGIIASLLAQGLSLPAAARTGVYLHGRAGDRAAADGERGLLALDLLPHLRTLVNP